jgi:hypothetical protein
MDLLKGPWREPVQPPEETLIFGRRHANKTLIFDRLMHRLA